MHVFHPASRTIHVDDTIMVDEPFKGDMLFHPSLVDGGLYHIPQSPHAFRDWVQLFIDEWDFVNICAAHNGVKLSGAKEQLISLLTDSAAIFDLLIADYTLTPNSTDAALFNAMNQHESQCKE